MRLTGAQIVVEYLARQGVPYIAGIPGHGSWAILDAVVECGNKLRIVQVMHEQSAVHLADGYYRVSGRPLMAFTSIGPGATNTVIGMGTAFVDSTAVMLVTGAPHTHMRGHAVLQELERSHWGDFPRVMEGVTKRHWEVDRVEQLPYVMHRAFNTMLTGRPGPVHLDLPMDVQTDAADVTLPDQDHRETRGRPRPDTDAVDRAARLLMEARRPVIIAGGGVITANASADLLALAEHLGAPVVTTWMGKGAIAEDHALCAWSIGDTASTCGNALAASADVVLSVGCRFTDWSTSSYRKGVTFSIPPSKLIQIDIDHHEIGKNYPAEVALVADAKAALVDLLAACRDGGAPRWDKDGPYFQEVARLKDAWDRAQGEMRYATVVPMTQARALHELRKVLPRETIVTTGAGIPQAVVRQDFPVYEPRTHITSGGFSTMGFTVPAALGAKLAAPDRPVVGVAGDGDFMQTMQEMAVAAMLNLPILVVVLNNAGWGSIRNGQLATFGRAVSTMFATRDGQPYTPHFANVAREFGLHGERVENPDDVGAAAQRAMATGGPALIEVMVAREQPHAGLIKTGWWDAPPPAYLTDRRRAYDEGKAEEQMG